MVLTDGGGGWGKVALISLGLAMESPGPSMNIQGSYCRICLWFIKKGAILGLYQV